MKIFKKMISLIRKIYRWYQEPIPGYRLVRVDPLTVIMIIGLLTTFWGVGRGIGVKITADNISDSLLLAPTILKSAIEEANLPIHERDVALEHVEMMTPIFDEFAEIIQNRGNKELIDAMGRGVYESVIALNPANQMGKLIGVLQAGRGVDTFISLYCINESIKEFDYSAVSFSEEQEQLRKQLEVVFRAYSDALLKARIRHTLNNMRQSIIKMAKKDPCKGISPDDLQYVKEKTLRHIDRNYRHLYGYGKKWSNADELFYWLMSEARGAWNQHITQTYESSLKIENMPLGLCFACVPPNLDGKIELTINLVTCEVQGKISGESGEGDGNVTVFRNCDENFKYIDDEKCTATGWLKFSGDIEGNVDRSSWKLNLKPVTVIYDYTHQWTVCRGVDLSQKSEHWEGKISLITGEIDYRWWDISGDFNWKTNACQLKADWRAYRTNKTVPLKTPSDRLLEEHQKSNY